MIKKIMAFLMLTMSIGCGACSSNLKSEAEVEDTSRDVPSWQTWETCAQSIGSHACDFDLIDQNGDSVSLYDFYGKAIVIDFSTEWCAYCQVAAQEAQEIQDFYGEGDLAYITILIETASGGTPDEEDAARWADYFGISTAPVLAGSRSILSPADPEGWQVSAWPTFFFITDDMKVHTSLRGYNQAWMQSLIEETMNQ